MDAYAKRNNTPFTDALLKEAQGLAKIAEVLSFSENSLLKVPELFSVDETSLTLSSIEHAQPTPDAMERLGRGLARLHQVQHCHFGLDEDNYLGLSIQPNIESQNWGTFFADKRLAFQISLIRDRRIREDYTATFRAIRPRLVEFLNEHCDYPSLLHGDFWAGNVLFDSDNIWLIDPAIYFGDREVDVAMSEMFGGFTPVFYAAYDAVLPRSKVYPLKRDIYNFYHYLNHYNLFGPAYLDGCERGMSALESL